MTHYRLASPEQVESAFSARALQELWIAEDEAPWGEMAENQRMMYLAARADAASDGFTEQARRDAMNRAQAIWNRLFGVQPPPEPPRASDLARD
jgi:hypothetical protein